MRTLLTVAFVALALARPLAGDVVRAQAPSASPAAAVPAGDTAVTAPASGEGYSYNPQGRRDPFLSLLARGADSRPGTGLGQRPEGIAGLAVSEISVRGVMQSPAGYVAIVQGPDNKTYIARAGDRLLDGAIRAIDGQGLVILQEVNDPLSLVKQREVRKGLRASDEGK